MVVEMFGSHPDWQGLKFTWGELMQCQGASLCLLCNEVCKEKDDQRLLALYFKTQPLKYMKISRVQTPLWVIK